jgi:TorA maturation chaperone TorD
MMRESLRDTLAKRAALETSRRGRGRRLTSDEALAFSELYRLLAAVFSYPDESLIRGVRSGLTSAEQSRKRDNLPISLAGPLRRLRAAWQAPTVEELALEYSRLFLGSALVPLREGGYGDGMRFAGQPVDLADLNGFYLAFGLGPPAAAASPPDHLGTELEFMSLLFLKLAYALERRMNEQAEITREAMGKFLEDHLGRWVPPLSAALVEAGASPAYRAAADLLVSALALETARLGVKPVLAGAGTSLDPVGLDEFKCPLASVPTD